MEKRFTKLKQFINKHPLFWSVNRIFLLLVALASALLGSGGLVISLGYDISDERMAFISFIFLGIALICHGLLFIMDYMFHLKDSKKIAYTYLYSGITFIVLGILMVALMEVKGSSSFIGIAFFMVSFAKELLIAIFSKHVRRYISTVLFGIVALVLSLLIAIDFNSFYINFAIIGIYEAVVSTVSIIAVAFSKIEFKTIRKVIQKTYAAEITFGLVALIIAFSFIFYVTESGFNNYFDGIWYCFTLVTTIGFGDLVTTSVIGRILSIILGVYGVIYVALLTSIIVNIYNETKDKHAHTDDDKKDKGKIEEDKKDTEK